MLQNSLIPCFLMLCAGCAARWHDARASDDLTRGSAQYRYAGETSTINTPGRIEVVLRCRDMVNSKVGLLMVVGRDSTGADTYPVPLSQGQYTIPEVPPGQYRLVSHHLGCYQNRVWIRVLPGSLVRVRVQLERAEIKVEEVGVSSAA